MKIYCEHCKTLIEGDPMVINRKNYCRKCEASELMKLEDKLAKSLEAKPTDEQRVEEAKGLVDKLNASLRDLADDGIQADISYFENSNVCQKARCFMLDIKFMKKF